MELHIKRLIDSRISKRNTYFLIGSYMLFIISFSLFITLPLYNLSEMGFSIIFVTTILEFVALGLLRQENRELKTISTHLVIVDEFQRFFYENQIFDLHTLKKVQYNKQDIALFFEDYTLLLEFDSQILIQLQSLNIPIIDTSLNLKKRTSLFCLLILLIVAFRAIFRLILGLIFANIYSLSIINMPKLVINLVMLTIVIFSLVLVRLIKKHGAIIYFGALLLILILVVIPSNNISNLSNTRLAYQISNSNVIIYDDVYDYFGHFKAKINARDVRNVDTFENIVYIEHEQTYSFYNPERTKQTLDQLLTDYDQRGYGNQSFNITIEDQKIYCNFQEVNDLSLIGYNTIYFNSGDPYLVIFNNDDISLKQLDSSYQDTLNLKDDLLNYQHDLDNQESNNIVENNPYSQFQASIRQELEQLDQRRYQDYQNMLQINDLSQFQPNENVIKIHDESNDIYQAIKLIDQEFTRIDNDDNVILDVQITNMLIYNQNDDQYGVYINRRIDSSVTESMSVQNVILMKKQGNDYYATRLYNIEYMPSDHPTNNGAYDTSWTTKYLYRIEGHEVGENAW